jgi:hypothetical protein
VTPPTVAPSSAAPATPPEPTHACVRCGRPVPIDVGLCELCNPLGLRDSSASQVHGLAFIGVFTAIVLLALVAHLAVSGIGPFDGSVTAATADGNGLVVTLSVTNKGNSNGQTTCRVMDPLDRTGNIGAFVLSPQIAPGQTATFAQRVTELGSTVRPLAAVCSAP